MPEPSPADPADRSQLLALARHQYATGAISAAWATVTEVAELSRRAADWATLADAATVIRPLHSPALMARVHDLCAAALARLGTGDPVRSARLTAQLVATSDPFGPDQLDLDPAAPPEDAEAGFLRLQARRAELQHPSHLGERLVLADAAIELGRRHGVDEFICWGRRWRMDVYAVLGSRLDLATELAALTPLVERLGQPAWQAYLLHVKASSRLLEGRFPEAADLNDRAAAIAGPDSEAAFLHPVFRATSAQLTGQDADLIVTEVQALVDDLPYLARGWLAIQLMAAGRREETAWEWKALIPHLARVPERAPEWLIATVGNANVCAWLGDVEAAPAIYAQLLPYAGLQAIGMSSGPYEGPVTLALGRLAVLLGRVEEGRRHLHAALRSCEEQHALPHLALTHAALAGTYRPDSSTGREHADIATRLAQRLGLGPLSMELASLPRLDERAGPSLTPRELQIAAHIARGSSNAAIAETLVLSERTVENHVSHILRKLDQRSRAGVASWYATTSGLRAPGSSPMANP